MTQLDLDILLAASKAGGAATMSMVTDLQPAEGEHGGVAPARFVAGRNGTYAYETRYLDGAPVRTVLVDSKSSQGNRIEVEIAQAIDDGSGPLGLTPRIAVSYSDGTREYDYTLPHRLFDGHVRAGSVDGTPTTQNAMYRAARDATTANVRSILELAPTALILGGWDSTRKTRQGRYRSALVGEIIGVLADQSPDGIKPPRRGGARVDPVAASVRLTGDQLRSLVDAQSDELSPNLLAKIEGEIKAAKNGRVSASAIGLGAIPPALEGLGLVACRRIVRSHVLSFSALRQLRFGTNPDGDAACRALLAAYALAGLARADSELNLRANCNLRESGPTVVELDGRHGRTVELEAITVDVADQLLADAIDAARDQAGIRWEGQVFEVMGNDLIINNADSDSDAEA